jgi:hypothetical protein
MWWRRDLYFEAQRDVVEYRRHECMQTLKGSCMHAAGHLVA